MVRKGKKKNQPRSPPPILPLPPCHKIHTLAASTASLQQRSWSEMDHLTWHNRKQLVARSGEHPKKKRLLRILQVNNLYSWCRNVLVSSLAWPHNAHAATALLECSGVISLAIVCSRRPIDAGNRDRDEQTTSEDVPVFSRESKSPKSWRHLYISSHVVADPQCASASSSAKHW